MPVSSQFALSLELANILPIKSTLSQTANSAISLMREFKRSGSDLLVEEDLAAIFGRAKIVSSVEAHFKDVVKIASVIPLHASSEIVLDAGPGATVRRGLKDRYYMATIIQLSFLGWMHETTSLAAILVQNMIQRFNLGVEGATPDPDYEGVFSTLQACLSQTSHYPWELLVQLIESKFPKCRSWLQLERSPLRRISPNTLLAAMDYLYLVQSLPDDRLIMIENQMGLIPITLWANCILGLRVLVEGSPDGDVFLGGAGNPQVIIKWDKSWQLYEAELQQSQITSLLDADMKVVLTTSPDDNEAVRLEGEERHRLEGYGTTFLRRLFNKTSVLADGHPLYQESAQFAIAFAISASRALRRVPFQHADDSKVPPQCCHSTKVWQIQGSSSIIFQGISLDWPAINGYSDSLIAKNGSWRIPPTIRTYLESFDTHNGKLNSSKKGQFISDVKRIASWILTFAQVMEVESCSQIPLIWDSDSNFCPGIMIWDGQATIDMPSNIWFSRIAHMLMGQTMGKVLVGSGNRLFLISERGWSLYHSNLGDNNPGSVNCEYLTVKRGVPTNTRTQERRYQISDAPRISPAAPPKGPAPSPWVIEKSSSYIPRCFTPIVKRTEYYSSRSKDFWLSTRYDIEEAWPDGVKKYSLYASHRQFHEALWGVVKTESCEHTMDVSESEELDLGVVTAKGFDWTEELGTKDHRICVCLVKGDPRARWLVVGGIIRNTDYEENVPDGLERQVLLRCESCCVRCAVEQASAMKGKWLVIL